MIVKHWIGALQWLPPIANRNRKIDGRPLSNHLEFIFFFCCGWTSLFFGVLTNRFVGVLILFNNVYLHNGQWRTLPQKLPIIMATSQREEEKKKPKEIKTNDFFFSSHLICAVFDDGVAAAVVAVVARNIPWNFKWLVKMSVSSNTKRLISNRHAAFVLLSSSSHCGLNIVLS